MLSIDEIVAKATTQTSNLQSIIPDIWAAALEINLRKRAVLQQSVVENTDLLDAPGDRVYIPTLPDMTPVDDLVEGTDMVPYALNNASSVTLTPAERGKVVEITRKALERIKYDGMAAIMDRLAYSMSQKTEGMIAALATASVPGGGPLTQKYPNGHTSATIVAADTFNDTLLLDGIAAMQANNCVPFDDGSFIVYVTPHQLEGLLLDANVRQDLRFSQPDKLIRGEVGMLHNAHIVVSNYLQSATENSVSVTQALIVSPRWAAIAWKRRPELMVDPTVYDLGRRRRFGVTADFDIELIHAERAFVLKSA